MRRERRWAGLIVMVCLAVAVPLGLIGCETGKSTVADRGAGWCPICKDYHRHEVKHAPKPAPKAEVKPAAPVAPAPAPVVRTGGLRCVGLAYPTGNKATSGIWLEKCVPAEVQMGQDFEFMLKVTNLTDITLTDVAVVDHIPQNFKLTSSTPEHAGMEGSAARWVFSSLAPQETKEIRVKGSATAPGTLQNCASVSYNSVLCAQIPVVEPKLQLVKTLPADVMICEPIPLKLVVTNAGSGTAANVVIRDTLPDGLVSGDNQTALTMNVGSLGPGQSQTLNAMLKAQRAGRFENKAQASADGGLSAEATAATAVHEPKLEITKTGAAKSFLGRSITYDLVVKNVGDGEARNTMVQDTLPANATFVGASAGGQMTGNVVQWNFGTLAPQESKTMSVTVSAAAAGTVVNRASAQAFCAAAVAATAQTEVSGIPAILLEVVDVEDPIEVGNNETYVVTVTNQGSAPDTNIRIVCTLEDQQEYVSSSGVTTGSAAGKTITFAPLASLAPKQQAVWRVVVKANAEGDVRFKVVMSSDQLGRTVEETEATHLYK